MENEKKIYLQEFQHMKNFNPYSEKVGKAINYATMLLERDNGIPPEQDIKKTLLLLMDYSLAVGFNKEHMEIDSIVDYVQARWHELD